jgi:hypothetical protein
VVVVTLRTTGFPSLPRLRACLPPMRLTEPPQLTRPDGLVVRRYGYLGETARRPPSLANASHLEQRPPLASPLTVTVADVFGSRFLAAAEEVCLTDDIFDERRLYTLCVT